VKVFVSHGRPFFTRARLLSLRFYVCKSVFNATKSFTI